LAKVELRADDLDALYGELRAAALGRISAPEARPWGVTEFQVWDPSGNLLRLGQPTPPPDRG